MRIYFSIVLAALTVSGCRTTFLDDPFGDDRKANLDVDAWSAPLADVSSMFDVRIPHFEVKVIPRTAALQKLESVWRSEVGGKALPVSFGAVPEEPWERNISFSATAIDETDGVITPTCNHSSGSNFPIGTTQVICTATDKAGNTAQESFSVKVAKLEIITYSYHIHYEHIVSDDIDVWNFFLTVKGVQGHTANGHRAENPVHHLSKLLTNILSKPLDDGNEYFLPTK